jgi:opacity protein-like surface antigen
MQPQRLKQTLPLVWLAIACAGLHGQVGDVGEVTAYAGPAFGALGTNGSVGAASGVEISKYALALIDTSYVQLGNHTLVNYPGLTAVSRLYDFNFTLHVQIPIKHRWSPYAVLSPALLFNTYQVQRLFSDGTVHIYDRDDAKFGFHTGGGLRWFVRENWGIKGEYRYTISTQNFSQVLGGVFYRFDGPWPFLPRSGRRRGGAASE